MVPKSNLHGMEMIMGCFEDYMDFREEVDKIKKKDPAKEELKGFSCLADPKIKATSNLKAP
jgi:hypothetical protein